MKEVGTIYLLYDLEKFREQETQRSHCGKSSVPLVFSPWRQKASYAIAGVSIYFEQNLQAINFYE